MRRALVIAPLTIHYVRPYHMQLKRAMIALVHLVNYHSHVSTAVSTEYAVSNGDNLRSIAGIMIVNMQASCPILASTSIDKSTIINQ